MRKQILLCASACFLFISYQSVGQAADKAFYDAKYKSNTQGQAKSDNNLVPASDNKKKETANLIDVTRTIDKTAAAVNEQPAVTSKADEQTQPDILKNDAADVKDSVSVAARKTDAAQGKETGKEKVNEAEFATGEETMSVDEALGPVITKYAQLIGVDRDDVAGNYSLYMFIDDWYGTRYKYGGTDSAGIDCSAFSQKVYGNVFGVEIMRTARQQRRHCERIRRADEANQGDLVFFRIHRFRISHVGIYLANGYFVHASSSHGVTISSLNDKYWHRRYAGCGRIPREEKSINESDFTP